MLSLRDYEGTQKVQTDWHGGKLNAILANVDQHVKERDETDLCAGLQIG